jgi:hypothetical protein
MATKLSLINNALILIGDVPLTSLTSGTRAQVVATSLYDNIVQSELSKFRWGFARTQTEMIRSVTPNTNPAIPFVPKFQWQAAYYVPEDCLSLITVSPSMPYQIYSEEESPDTTRNQMVYCNFDSQINDSGQYTPTNFYADYIRNVDENEWPAYFAKMIEYALAMDFAPSIRDSASSMQILSQQYLNASRMARYTDSQQHPQTAIQDQPFINVRY